MKNFRITSRLALASIVAVLLTLGQTPAEPVGVGLGIGPVELDEYSARCITRIAVLDNRYVLDPGPADYEITSLLLEQAQRLWPNDEGIIRTRLDAALTGGDMETAIEQTRKLIAVNPGDTVAQLRLISHIINQEQTVDRRLEIVERFLGPDGEKIPGEVRSRLALDAALWHRDHGNNDEFIKYLAMATALDSTNKLAAYMATNYYASASDDPVGQLELLTNLLLADPLDPQTHLAIATELAEGGALAQALRFQNLALRLVETTEEYAGEHIVQGALVLTWQTQGAAAAVEILNQRLVVGRDELARKIRQAEAAGSLRADAPDPSDMNLTFPEERMRLLAASAAGDSATAAAAASAMRAITDQGSRRAADEGVAEEEILRSRLVLEADRALMLLWVGLDVQQALADAEALIGELEQSELDQDAIHLLRAFMAIRTDDPDLATDLLGQVVQESLLVDAGLALAAAARRDVEGAESALSRVAVGHPLEPIGAWARSKLLASDPGANPFGPNAERLAALAASVPDWLDRSIDRPGAFMSMRVEAINPDVKALERGGLRVRIKNTSPIPLGVGADRPINTQLLFAPSVAIDVNYGQLRVPSEVVNAARRLRLAPREELVVEVYPYMWPGGAMIDLTCAHSTRIRTRVVQGFVPSKGMGFEPGPLCVAADGPPVIRRPLTESVMGFDALIARLRNDPEATLPTTLALLEGWHAVPTPSQGPLTPEQVAQIGQAAADRYASLSPAGKAMMLAMVPTAARAPEMEPLRLVALAETDPRAMPMVLLTCATDPEDPIFARAAASGDETVVRLGALLKGRLSTDEYAFSTFKIPVPGSGG